MTKRMLVSHHIPPRKTDIAIGGITYSELTDLEVSFITCWERWGTDDFPIHNYRYAPGTMRKADFAWPGSGVISGVIVECEGYLAADKGHGSVTGRINDLERANLAAANGWLRFRCWAGTFQDWDTAQRFIEAIATTVRANVTK